MRLRDRPLNPDDLDRPIYVERPALEDEIAKPLRQNRNVLLIGRAGSGKTTVMRQMQAQLEAEGIRTAWVNAALAHGTEELLEMADAALGQDGESPPVLAGTTPASRLLALTRAIGTRPPATILLDGLDEARLGFDLFGRLRDELWATGHAWLVSGRPPAAVKLRTPPAEAFWGAAVEIPPLSPEEVDQFVEVGLNPEERSRLRPDLELFGQTPRLLIREFEAALAEEDSGHAASLQALIDAASDLGQSEATAMTELVGLGRPASVWDPELAERLGWSRAYAQRIFARLEQAALVRSSPERAPEQGRPRKLYEPEPKTLA
jgi:predicted transcriptional regulator